MATFSILTNDILEVVIGQLQNNQQILNVLHYQFRGSVTITDGDAEVQRVIEYIHDNAASVVAKMKLAQIDELSYNYVRGSIVAPLRKRYLHYIAAGTGAIMGDPCPPNVSMVLTKQSSLAGRGRSGRMSIGGVPFTGQANGILTEAQLNLLEDVAAAVMADIDVAGQSLGWRPVLWSPGGVGVAPSIADVFAQPTTRVVRRRTVGQGI